MVGDVDAFVAKLITADGVLVISHRGDSGRAPENTLAAFELAVKCETDLTELDYRHSADGVPVVFHDELLDRTTNAPAVFGKAKIPLESKSIADLRTLDAGSWFDAKFAGVKIPTLDEALDLIQTGSTALIERKSGDAEMCVALLDQKQLLDRVVVQSFDWHFLAECHRLAPTLVLGALGKDKLHDKQLEDAEKLGASIVVWNHKHIAQRDIQRIHDRGFRAWAYTVNDQTTAKELTTYGVDGIITDRPREMQQLLRSA